MRHDRGEPILFGDKTGRRRSGWRWKKKKKHNRACLLLWCAVAPSESSSVLLPTIDGCWLCLMLMLVACTRLRTYNEWWMFYVVWVFFLFCITAFFPSATNEPTVHVCVKISNMKTIKNCEGDLRPSCFSYAMGLTVGRSGWSAHTQKSQPCWLLFSPLYSSGQYSRIYFAEHCLNA